MRTDDGHIIRECINGDSASFGLLVDKYKAGIFALALSILLMINGKIYSLGGFTNNFKPCSTVEEYTPEGWKAISPQGKMPKTWGNLKSR